MKINFRILTAIFSLSVILLLSGCHTAAGFGQDIQQGGADIQKAAER